MQKGVPLFLFLLTCTIATSQPAKTPQWPQEPDSFAKIPWGSSEKEADQGDDSPLYGCFDMPDHRACSAEFVIGDVVVTGFFKFKNDQFVYAIMRFDSAQYPFIKNAFVTKYGKPKSAKINKLRNPMGAEFQNEMLSWYGHNVQATLARYSDKITEGTIEIGLNLYIKEMSDKNKDKAKKAIDDF